MKPSKIYEQLLVQNKNWAEDKKDKEPKYFKILSKDHKPPFLFISCSDSRIPMDTYTQTEPGELFIHRNIANQISLTDMNFLSVLEYAVFSLKVKHIIVCGHYYCGGVEAAYKDSAQGLVENWVTPIKDLIKRNKSLLDDIHDERAKLNFISEINVIDQVKKLFKVSMIENIIKEGKEFPTIHGWILDISHGTIKELTLPIEKWKEEGIVPKNY
jgi:carbonic anhydrase